jgi:hypothetical protein
MNNPDHVTKYVAVFRDGSALGTLTQLYDHPLPPPHPSGFIGSFPVQIPRWQIECSKVHPAPPLRNWG